MTTAKKWTDFDFGKEVIGPAIWLAESITLGRFQHKQNVIYGGGGGTTQPLPRDGGAEELRGDPTVGPHPKVWTIDRE